MVRLVTVLAPVACLAGAYALDQILSPYSMVMQEKVSLKKTKRMVSSGVRKEHVYVAFIVVFLVLGFNLIQGLSTDNGIIQPASLALEYKTPTGLFSYGDWYQALSWLEMNTPTTAVVASWWDYGYWLSLANRTLITDGATISSQIIGNIGAMFVSTPDYALKIAAHYDIDYILILLGQGSSQFDNDLGKVQWMVRIAEARGNLAQEVGHPIVAKNFFTYASNGQISGYAHDFFKSLIWSLMTDNVSSNVLSSFEQQQVVSSSITTTGFPAQYVMYKQIFQEMFMTNNNFIRIVKINWNAAQRLVGVTK